MQNNTTFCIVLAGGLGTRLRQVIGEHQKCVALISNRHFIEIQLEHLSRQGINKFIISLGYKSQQVINAIKNIDKNFEINVITEKNPLGTGGAILNTMSAFGLEEALAVNGDTFLNGNLSEMLRPLDHHSSKNEKIRMAIVEVEDTSRFGRISFQKNSVITFDEKKSEGSGFINAGLYRININLFNDYVVGEQFSLEIDVLKKAAINQELTTSLINGAFFDIGTPDDYYKFCKIFKKEKK